MRRITVEDLSLVLAGVSSYSQMSGRAMNLHSGDIVPPVFTEYHNSPSCTTNSARRRALLLLPLAPLSLSLSLSLSLCLPCFVFLDYSHVCPGLANAFLYKPRSYPAWPRRIHPHRAASPIKIPIPAPFLVILVKRIFICVVFGMFSM